ncbi:hypothetical protein A5667_24900 [Mycolicibacterium fortuitum]|uniref:hypothetical protein n=1 Tax=Mycolicibacterium fortuitum TaxID=1766 RepID=UPI0007EDCA57|nr:hypothetical protein [Mycolicibacterium fortuitum]OBI54673.1 hypothetical protein A5667_24900 [Mycolicibacterium fortuitum]
MKLDWQFFAEQEEFFSCCGVYAATFAHHVEDLMSGREAPIKVGWSRNVIGRFNMADRSFVPSPVVGVRLYLPGLQIWEDLADEAERMSLLIRIESHCHCVLKANGYENPYRYADKRCGREWFVASLTALDQHLQHEAFNCAYRIEEHDEHFE